MSNDDHVRKPRTPRKQRKRTASRASIFSSKRSSFLSASVIHRRESQKSFENQLSLRRQSGVFSSTVNETDILNPHTRIRLDWKDIRYCVITKTIFGKTKSEKCIINGVSGSVSPGTTVAILGPSGAGKSTLLNILAGKTPEGKIDGQIFMNGLKRIKEHLQIIAFVEQDCPYLDKFLTVKEILDMTADLTLPKHYTKDQKAKQIAKVMKSTGIERIANTKVGGQGEPGISGGERKKLAIAKELLRDPKILFLDEPTSGLDASTSAGLVKFLRELAILDHLTIIMTIHQPRMSVLSKFDFFILLAQGKTVFSGNVDEALEYFAKQGFVFVEGQNPADFFLDTLSISDELSQSIVKKFQQEWEPMEKVVSDEIEEMKSDLSTQELTKFIQPVNRFKEFKVLLKWKFRGYFRDKDVRYTLIFEFVCIFFLLMSVFFQIPMDGFAAVQNRIGFIPFVSYDTAALMGFCVLMVSERNRVIDERRSAKYRLSSYYVASVLVEIFLWAVIPLPFWIGLYYIVHLRYTPFTALLIFLGMQIGYLMTAVFVGGIIGLLIDDLSGSLRVVNMFWFVCKIFGGTSVNTNNLSPILRWIRYIAPAYLFQAGLFQNEFIGQTINDEPGVYWIESFGFNGASEMWCAGGLMIMIAGLYLISFSILWLKTTPKFKI
jgi:ABC-type multidrug transport system ATPase subunit